MTNGLNLPGYLFEVSWEVCNKVGGIYTVIATKSLFLKEKLHRHHILVGPDVWMDTDANPDFSEDPLLSGLGRLLRPPRDSGSGSDIGTSPAPR